MHRDFNVDKREVLEPILMDLSKIGKEIKLSFQSTLVTPQDGGRVSEGRKKMYQKILL